MQNTYYLIITLLLLVTGCSEEAEVYQAEKPQKSISLKLIPQKGFNTRVIDEDNLASEQTVLNLSVFLTEPLSSAITHKFIYPGFTTVNDYKLISLPLDPATVLSKDIYIVANYDNASTLNSVSTLDDLKALTTPVVDKTKYLMPENGLCMYGATLNFDFNNSNQDPAIVNLIRTCSKIRLSLTFPENPTLSADNHFLIAKTAKYTHVIKNYSSALPSSDYFTYAAQVPLTDNGSQKYINTAYIYEATSAPVLYIYTDIGNTGTQQEFSVTLPMPRRNDLYDIKIEVYEGEPPSGTKSMETHKNNQGYSLRSVINIYPQDGQRMN